MLILSLPVSDGLLRKACGRETLIIKTAYTNPVKPVNIHHECDSRSYFLRMINQKRRRRHAGCRRSAGSGGKRNIRQKDERNGANTPIAPLLFMIADGTAKGHINCPKSIGFSVAFCLWAFILQPLGEIPVIFLKHKDCFNCISAGCKSRKSGVGSQP